MKPLCQPSSIQSHYCRTPEILCNDESFLGFQFAREEHNASFFSNKIKKDTSAEGIIALSRDKDTKNMNSEK